MGKVTVGTIGASEADRVFHDFGFLLVRVSSGEGEKVLGEIHLAAVEIAGNAGVTVTVRRNACDGVPGD